MMKKFVLQLSLFLSILLFSCSSDNIKDGSVLNRNLPLDSDWKFLRDSVAGAENPSFDDSGWRNIDLPHDWSIENFADNDNEDHIGPFTKTSEGGSSTGQVKGGTAWYRKHFIADKTYSKKQVSLCFDGVYMISSVWVNGKKAGDHYYGYTPFSYDITDYLSPGKDNVIAVEVKNPGRNSRWYSGSGIYRHVWLTVTNPLRVAENGLFVTTDLTSKDSAKIHISVQLKNSGSENIEASLVTFISDSDASVIDKTEKPVKIGSDGTLSIDLTLTISQPSLWSVDNPHLYSATSEVVLKGKVIDSYSVTFGVRTLSFSADTSGQRIAHQLINVVKSLDNTRPVTAAVCFFWEHPGMEWSASEAAFASLDVGGYNYVWREYENDHKKYPDRIMAGTESFPIEAFENWQQVEKYPWVIGDFVWTGMDYLGESGIGHAYYDKENPGFIMPWPWYNAWCGDIDIIGQKKAQSFFRDVVWNRSKLEMAVHAPLPNGKTEGISLWGWPQEYQSWTWPGEEENSLQVSLYSSCQEVRLELNGKVIGQKKTSDNTRLTAKFDVPYSAGELKAVGLIDGKEVATKLLKTAGKPASLGLISDRVKINADRNDLAYVTVEVRDKDGNLVPDSDIHVKFTVTGDGELLASGNAAPDDMKSFRKPECKTYNGKCLAIIRPFTKAGSIIVTAESEGIPAAVVEITTQ